MINNFIFWVGLSVISFFLYLTINALAGKTTLSDIGIKVFVNVELGKMVVIIFGAGSIFYGLGQRSLRRKTVERLHERIRKYEQDRDPGRTSSGLTPRGETHPKDR